MSLPDGRIQIVSYHADPITGFKADVSYEDAFAPPAGPHGPPAGSLGPSVGPLGPPVGPHGPVGPLGRPAGPIGPAGPIFNGK